MSPNPDPALLHNAPKAKPRQAQPGEPLFEFYRERDHTRWLFELRDHADYGFEVQVYRNEEFLMGRRFDPRLDPSRPTRELAIQWATEMRREIESDDGRERQY